MWQAEIFSVEYHESKSSHLQDEIQMSGLIYSKGIIIMCNVVGEHHNNIFFCDSNVISMQF